ncbi:toll/interleukin-1 receptor domain-containing protein [Zoogloea sp.]|uniref:toll/interleukin-1 receptor domain-containing protein n=1 Tax=Zoogloea sp. TaxID=49181 RepID=UPI0035B158C1
MPVFISHSFENKPEFNNVVAFLGYCGVDYWNPAEIKPGASLREQLRAAVGNCQACIFIATRHAVASSWCGSELGAFWGAGKPIIVYLAESSLPEAELPSIVQGDVWEREIPKVCARAKELVSAPENPTAAVAERDGTVGHLSIEQLQKIIVGAVSLAAAEFKERQPPRDFDELQNAATGVAGKVLAGFQVAESLTTSDSGDAHARILWVDDRPDNNIYERKTMEAMGFSFVLARSTAEALAALAAGDFAAIISDMGRKEGPKEGYVLLEAVRATDQRTPFFIYASSRAPEHRREAALRGAQGATNLAAELVEMVVHGVRRSA